MLVEGFAQPVEKKKRASILPTPYLHMNLPYCFIMRSA
jgi:hypothetical protein